MTENFRVGVVTSTHGVHGEVKVFPTTDDAKRFKKLKCVTCSLPKGKRELEIEGVKFFKQMVILKFKGIDRMEDAEPLRGGELYIPRSDALKLDEDEYYTADLIGLKVVTDEGEELGIVDDVIQTGANDVYVVKRKSYPEVLIPAIKDCVINIDIEGGQMLVHLLPGMV